MKTFHVSLVFDFDLAFVCHVVHSTGFRQITIQWQHLHLALGVIRASIWATAPCAGQYNAMIWSNHSLFIRYHILFQYFIKLSVSLDKTWFVSYWILCVVSVQPWLPSVTTSLHRQIRFINLSNITRPTRTQKDCISVLSFQNNRPV